MTEAPTMLPVEHAPPPPPPPTPGAGDIGQPRLHVAPPEPIFTALPPAPPARLFAKLAEVFAELDDVERDKRHENQGWAYASADAVLRAVREPLRQRQVLVLSSTRGKPAERTFKTSGNKDRVVTTVGLTFTFVDAESGETWAADWQGAGADDAEKGLSKAITVGLRTFLRDQFLLPEGEDTSGTGGGGRGRGGGRGTNDAGEKLASHQQLQEIEQAATGRMPALAFLNALLAARSVDQVTVDQNEALKRYPEQLKALTTQQATDALARVKALAGAAA